MGIVDPDQANLAIREGLTIEGKHVPVRQQKSDPKRCWKCQQIGAKHFSGNCKAEHDTCARCAGPHRTIVCTITDCAAYQCVNCKGMGHGAADRNCPVFTAKFNKLRVRPNDVQYRFFPTQDPSTWEQEVDSSAGILITENNGATAVGRDEGPRRSDGGRRPKPYGADWRPRTSDNGWNRVGCGHPTGAPRVRGPREEAGLSFPADANSQVASSSAPRNKQVRIDDMFVNQPRPTAATPAERPTAEDWAADDPQGQAPEPLRSTASSSIVHG